MKLVRGNFLLFEKRKFKLTVAFNPLKIKEIIQEPIKTLKPVLDIDYSNDKTEDKAHYVYLLGLEILLREIQEQEEAINQKKLINPSKKK